MTVERALRDVGYFWYHYWLLDEYLIWVTDESVPRIKDNTKDPISTVAMGAVMPKSPGC